ncbi:MAG TPA: PDDEXK nuclease domain-containing protein [Candidatus Ozemobacteraceae bacterium]
MASKKSKENPDSKRLSLGRQREGAIIPGAAALTRMPEEYGALLREIKERIGRERLRTVLAANAGMILLYWDIGKAILARQEAQGWGAHVIDRLSADLRKAFPDMKGFSPRNLKYMRAFAAAWPDSQFVQQGAAQIPWFHNCLLLERVADEKARIWYVRQAIAQGWSRNILALQIENDAYQRQGKVISNFSQTLPPAESDMAAQMFKDPYLFDFLGTADQRQEREVENALVDHIQRFLLEMGAGFAFVGRQVHLEVGDQDFYIDLLFYHLKLRCFVVVELKATAFNPGFVGQLNLYLSVVDDLMRHPEDKPTIGLLLCRDKNKLVVEYALRDLKKPVGVASWETRIVKALPKELHGALPSIDDLEREMDERKDRT